MKTAIIIAFAVALLPACKQTSRQNLSNLNVHIIEHKSYLHIKTDDFVWLNYTVKTNTGIVVYGNYNHLLFRDVSVFKGDFGDALGSLGAGDSAVVKVSIDSLRKYKNILPVGIKGQYLLYYIRIKKVITRVGQPSHISDSALNAQIEVLRMKARDDDRQKELGRIKNYLSTNNLHPSVTASGLYYSIEKMGSGPKPTTGELSIVNLTIKYVDGELFYTSKQADAMKAGITEPKKYEPLELYLGRSYFIKGIEEGLLLLPAGTKATLIIPTKLSNPDRYGYTPLICNVEVLKIRRPTPGEKLKMLHEEESAETAVKQYR